MKAVLGGWVTNGCMAGAPHRRVAARKRSPPPLACEQPDTVNGSGGGPKEKTLQSVAHDHRGHRLQLPPTTAVVAVQGSAGDPYKSGIEVVSVAIVSLLRLVRNIR